MCNSDDRFKEYKLAIETQMHFNEMILRARTLGLTAVIFVFGAAFTLLKNDIGIGKQCISIPFYIQYMLILRRRRYVIAYYLILIVGISLKSYVCKATYI